MMMMMIIQNMEFRVTSNCKSKFVMNVLQISQWETSEETEISAHNLPQYVYALQGREIYKREVQDTFKRLQENGDPVCRVLHCNGDISSYFFSGDSLEPFNVQRHSEPQASREMSKSANVTHFTVTLNILHINMSNSGSECHVIWRVWVKIQLG